MTKRKIWTRNELIAAFNLYCKIPFGKIHANNTNIIELARILGRSNSSVSLKLANFARLDPALQKRNISGMSHGSKAEIEIWNEFHGNWDELAWHSEKILADLRKESIEKTSKIDIENLPEKGIEREKVLKIRVNQTFFRKTILASYNYCCCITGLAIPELLIASHIIPWSIDQKNRVNPSNGLCLNALHDKAFDIGLITIMPDYKIKNSEIIKNLSFSSANFLKKFDNKKIILPDKFLPSPDFLEYHNQNIFRPN